ncbi:MAG: S-layer homology domain-containing protein [Candidatus Margulisbacteria bacterium]|nr:S-layer homology domain-containing protein [Candidatus Margulisiibacteriota bacterium]
MKLLLKTVFLLVSVSFLFAEFTVDPSLAKTSARSVALGNAFSAMADDYSALYVNPAGMTQVKNMEFGMMQNTLLDSVFSFNGAGIFPMKNMTVGVGGLFNGVSGIPITDRNLANSRIISVGSSDYSNTLLSVAIASKFKTPFTQAENLSLGLSGKMFMERVGGAVQSNAIGYNADFGALYQVNPALDLSLVYHNFLPYGVKWDTDHNANLDYSMTVGGRYTIMGNKQENLIYMDNQTLDILGDIDFMNANSKLIPKVGIEYKPYPFLALRAGVVNDYDASDPANVKQVAKYAIGVGVAYQGFRIDYAYSLDPNSTDNNSHYVSMLVDIFSAKPAEERELSYINLTSISDKLITYKKYHKIAGTVAPGQVAKIKVNENFVTINNNSFSTDISLGDYGKYVVRIKAFDANNKLLGYQDIRILYLASFDDVKDKYWAKKYIEELATAKVIQGYPDNTYRPDNLIKRSEFSALLVRTKKIPFEGRFNKDDVIFKDLKNHWAMNYVMAAYQAGLVTGYENRMFKPEKPTIRQEAVISMVKMDDLILPVDIPKSQFSDMKDNDPLNRYVSVAADHNLIVGYPDGTFKPARNITRAEMAKIFYNSQLGSVYITDLFDWSTYKYNEP